MKIIELRAQNIKNLKAIEIAADGKTVILSGKNEVGKSSVIDAITMALTGQMVERPIKDGEARAEVAIDLGEYLVKRVWTAAGNRLEVSAKDGAKYASPQAMLDKMIGQLSFDPLAFKDMGNNAEGKRKQRDLLMKVVGLDFGDLDAKRKEVYDRRTFINHKIVEAESVVAKMNIPAEGVPADEIIIGQEIEKLRSIEDQRTVYLAAVRDKEYLHNNIEDIKSRIAGEKERQEKRVKDFDLDLIRINGSVNQRVKELEDLIARTRDDGEKKVKEIVKLYEDEARAAGQRIDEYAASIGRIEASIDSFAMPPEIPQSDIDALRTRIKEAEGINIAVRNAQSYRTFKNELEVSRTLSNGLTDDLAKIDADKAQQIIAAQYPVPGLGVSDDSILYNDLPFSQASDGVKIRVSTAIAMKINPNLRVILIKEASLLDSESLKGIIDMAKENDYQLFIERVSDSGTIEVHIEE